MRRERRFRQWGTDWLHWDVSCYCTPRIMQGRKIRQCTIELTYCEVWGWRNKERIAVLWTLDYLGSCGDYNTKQSYLQVRARYKNPSTTGSWSRERSWENIHKWTKSWDGQRWAEKVKGNVFMGMKSCRHWSADLDVPLSSTPFSHITVWPCLSQWKGRERLGNPSCSYFGESGGRTGQVRICTSSCFEEFTF